MENNRMSASLSLAQADQIIDAALRRATELDLHPIAVAVLDAGGHLVAFRRQDHTGILRRQIAEGKAWGTLGMGVGSRALAHRAETAPQFIAALGDASQGRLIPVPGGVLIRDDDGEIIGAVGVSGDLSDNDESCAVYGIEAAKLTADPGQAPHA
jgi:uncharacterized protein GlcG (DUF336 family)